MDSSSSAIAAVFDRAADTYDSVGVPFFQVIAAGLVEELAVQSGERVLDVGCGRGAALLPLALAAGPSSTVVGIDLAPRMVELAALAARELPQVQVRIGDAAAPDLPVASFDVIASSLVLFFMPDPLAALRQWVALLDDRGRLGVSTFGPQDERWQHLDSMFAPYLPPAMLDARTSGRRGPFSSDDGVCELLGNAGLIDVRTAHRSVEAVFRDPDHLLEFTWSHGQRAMWEAVPKEQHEILRHRIVDQARQFLEASGEIRFTQEIRLTLGHLS